MVGKNPNTGKGTLPCRLGDGLWSMAGVILFMANGTPCHLFGLGRLTLVHDVSFWPITHYCNTCTRLPAAPVASIDF